MSNITNLVIENNKLTFNYDQKAVTIKRSQVYPQIKVLLSQAYRQELRQIEHKQHLSLKASIMSLIDLYYLKTPEILDVLLEQFLKRLEQGINRSYALRLKSIYIAIGHFLKKYRYI